jgi:hypothetical protein
MAEREVRMVVMGAVEAVVFVVEVAVAVEGGDRPRREFDRHDGTGTGRG